MQKEWKSLLQETVPFPAQKSIARPEAPQTTMAAFSDWQGSSPQTIVFLAAISKNRRCSASSRTGGFSQVIE